MISILQSAVCSLRNSFVLLTCLVVLASYSPVSAQKFDNTTVESHKQTEGEIITYEIKGITTAIDIPQGAQSVMFKFELQRYAGGWNTQITCDATKTPSMGKATYDTGYRPINPGPGEKWRGQVTGVYILNGTPYNVTP